VPVDLRHGRRDHGEARPARGAPAAAGDDGAHRQGREALRARRGEAVHRQPDASRRSGQIRWRRDGRASRREGVDVRDRRGGGWATEPRGASPARRPRRTAWSTPFVSAARSRAAACAASISRHTVTAAKRPISVPTLVAPFVAPRSRAEPRCAGLDKIRCTRSRPAKRQNQIIAPHLTKFRANRSAAAWIEPAPTVTANSVLSSAAGRGRADRRGRAAPDDDAQRAKAVQRSGQADAHHHLRRRAYAPGRGVHGAAQLPRAGPRRATSRSRPSSARARTQGVPRSTCCASSAPASARRSMSRRAP
jgi:hypothetical protein